MERLSIILEIFAFFLVTTDLYGETRLAMLHERLKQSNARLSLILSRHLQANETRMVRVFSRGFVSAQIKGMLIVSTLVVSLVVCKLLDAPVSQSILLSTSIVLVVVYVIGFEWPTLVALYRENVLQTLIYIVALLRWLLDKKKTSDWLLLIGVISFVMSKGIALSLAPSGDHISK
jgi:hypothetical protein